MKHYTTILGALIASCVLFACSTQKEEEIPVSSVNISQPAAEMIIGETVRLSATVSPSNAAEKSIVWASSKQSVATVDQNGSVFAVAEGTSTITASAGGKSANCIITVSKGAIEVSSVELNKTTLELEIGKSETLIATIFPEDATDKTIQWSSSNSSVATVENSGKVSAIAAGTASITAECGGKIATCSINVIDNNANAISLSQTSLSMLVGDTYTLTINNLNGRTATWSSSSTSIASVDNGYVQAKKVGKATIKAKVDKYVAECSVSVSASTSDPNCIIKYKTSGNRLTSRAGTHIEPEGIKKIGTLLEDRFENGEGQLIYKEPITKIPYGAFDDAINIKEIELPNSVKVIEEYAFVQSNCSIIRISLGNSVEQIGACAFLGCLFSQINLPSTVKSIEASAFEKCVRLESISVPCQFKNDCFTECTSLKQVTLSSGITYIPNYAFLGCKALTSITLPSSVATIGKWAFHGCKALSSFSFNNGLKTIGEYAFYECSNLHSIYVPSSLETMEYGAFAKCPVESIYLSNLKNWCEIDFGAACFSNTNRQIYINNSEIIDLVIPDGTTKIGRCAFISCGNLLSVTVPNSVVESYYDSYDSSFEYSTNIYKITVGQTLAKSRIRAYCGDASKITEVIITNTTELVYGAFRGCKNLTRLTLPKDLNKIGDYAFDYCKALTSLTVLATTPPTLADASVFRDSEQLSSINVPKESVQAYQKAWYNYKNLIKAIE